jgi:Rrf2 family iron-sulfur cluster assembly transcriptional regulator
MRLSTKGRYAVTAMVDIARHGGNGPVNLASVAARQEISLSYLEQLFSKLGRKGLVKSMRGPGGGFSLARPADQIAIAAIVEAAEESIKTTNCSGDPTTGCRSDKSRCLTHDLWEELGGVIHNYLSSKTLQDVLTSNLDHDHACAARKDYDFITDNRNLGKTAHG